MNIEIGKKEEQNRMKIEVGKKEKTEQLISK
jgi:hypothetical protein